MDRIIDECRKCDGQLICRDSITPGHTACELFRKKRARGTVEVLSLSPDIGSQKLPYCNVCEPLTESTLLYTKFNFCPSCGRKFRSVLNNKGKL